MNINRKPKVRIRAIIYVAVGLSCLVYTVLGSNVSFSEQWVIYEAIRQTSAIIFGVMGAWVAILKPDELKLLARSGQLHGEKGQVVTIKSLTQCMVVSFVIVFFVLLVGLSAPIVRSLLMPGAVIWARAASALSLSLLFWLQLWAIVMALVPFDRSLAAYQDECTRVKLEKNR